MSSQSLKTPGTHVTNLEGRISVRTVDIGNPRDGDMYYDNGDNKWFIYDGTNWNGITGTTTSTSSSTSTSTTTTTSA
jgi:hypothetical protein